MSDHVLITGGSSKFVPDLLRRLRQDGSKISLLSKQSDLTALGSDVLCVNADLNKPLALSICPNVVVHLASKVPYNLDPDNFSMNELIAENINIFSTVMKFCLDKKVKKVIYVSSTDVYPLYNENVIVEKTQVEPRNFYGCSKLAGERIAETFENLFNIRCTILRLGAVYGLGLSNSRTISKLLEEVNRGKEIEIFGANNILSLLNIEQASEAIYRSINAEPGLFNIAGRPETLKEFFNKAYREAGFCPKITCDDTEKATVRMAFDLRKAERDLNWKP